MDAKLKADWVKALRSGAYQQAKHCLRDASTAGFCCLGVLADMQGAKWNVGEPLLNGKSIRRSDHYYLVYRAAGGLSLKQQRALALLNDEGSPFPEIADYIEANL